MFQIESFLVPKKGRRPCHLVSDRLQPPIFLWPFEGQSDTFVKVVAGLLREASGLDLGTFPYGIALQGISLPLSHSQGFMFWQKKKIPGMLL